MEYTAGDFILVRGTGLFDRLIQFGQSLRFSKEQSKFNHTALIVASDGSLIEAIGGGVKLTNISKYPVDQFKIIHINASVEDRTEMISFAKSCLNDGYGFLNFICAAFCVLTGLKLIFGFSSTDICSGLIARALERTSFIPRKDPIAYTPADLAKDFEKGGI
ncbi:MAG: hypothetical protein KGI08_10805 [Thaumarchaeota archaeon]|nr:hypothetical protein [Nitrososphaerota archaeon]